MMRPSSGPLPILTSRPISTKSNNDNIIKLDLVVKCILDFIVDFQKNGKRVTKASIFASKAQTDENTYGVQIELPAPALGDSGSKYTLFVINQFGGLKINMKRDGLNSDSLFRQTPFLHAAKGIVPIRGDIPSQNEARIKNLKMGDTVIEAQVYSQEVPTLIWYNSNDEKIEDGREILITSQSEGAQHIAKLRFKTPKVAGCYKLSAANQSGESFAYTIIAKNRIKESEMLELQNAEVLNSDGTLRVEIECKFSSGKAPSSSWYKEGVQLKKVTNKVDLDQKIIKDGITCFYMNLLNPNLADVGDYEMIAQSANSNSAKIRFRITEEHVKIKSIGTPPKFVNKPKDKVVQTGASCEIEGTFLGDQPIIVEWTKNGKAIDSQKNVKIVTKENTTRLSFSSFNKIQSGLYKCILQNEFGLDSFQIKITAEEDNNGETNLHKGCELLEPHSMYNPCLATRSISKAPVFLIPPQNVKVQKDKNLIVDAKVEASPFPKVEWMKGNKVLNNGPKYKIQQNPNTGSISLEIIRSKLTDEGMYSLKARNLDGDAVAEFWVYVEEKGQDMDLRSQLKKRSSQQLPGERLRSTSSSSIVSDQESGDEKSIKRLQGDGDRRPSGTDTIQWPSLKKTAVKKKDPDRWLKGLSDLQVNEMDLTATLQATFCKNGGTLRWYKNRVEIFHGLKYNFVSHGAVHKLIIRKLHPDDSGRYMVSVNGIETKAWLEVAAGKVVYEFYKLLATKMEVFRTKPTILECHVNNQDCPIKWFKGKEQIKPDNEHFKMYIDGVRCVLRIQRTQKEDEGVFTCMIDDERQSKTTCYLYVTEPQWRFRRKLPDSIVVNEHDDLVLEVEVEDPEAECEWFYQGEVINQDIMTDKYTFISDGHIRKMIIHNSDPSLHSGKYECRTGVMSTFTNTQVKPALKIKQGLSNVQIKEGDDLVLKLQLNMNDKLISWFKDGHRVMPSDSCKITSDSEGNYQLKISNPSVASAGQYSIIVDDIESKCSVEIEEADYKPKFENEIGSVWATVGEEIRIPVKAIGKPKPSYKILVNGKSVKNSNIKKEETPDGLVLIVTKAARGDTGTYSIIASNNIGTSQLDVKIHVTGTQELHIEPPKAPTGPIKITRVTNNSCSITWQPPIDDGGRPITGYIVEKLDESLGEWIAVGQCAEGRYTVPELDEGKRYKFRVKAISQAGQGNEYLETEKSILAKPEFDPPSAPGTPVACEVTNNSIRLKWVAAQSAENARVEKYLIEMRSKSGHWSNVAETNGNLNEVLIDDLKDNTDYEFRVTAVNVAGKGKASENSTVIHTLKNKLAPRIEKTALKPLQIKSSQQLAIKVPFTAEPQPKVTWLFNGKELNKNDANFLTEENNTCLMINSPDRNNSGTYTLQLANEVGSDSAEIEILVLDKPSPPVGPLQVSNVTKSSVNLEWMVPLHMGGRPLLNYIVEKREKGGEWTKVNDLLTEPSCKVANLKEGREYEFRVKAENFEGVSEALTTECMTLVKDPYDKPDAPGKPLVVSRDRSAIKIRWSEPPSDGGATVQCYIIERFDNLTNKWRRLDKLSATELEYEDNKVRSDNEYRYRVYACNIAGQSENSDESDTIVAKPEKEEPKITTSISPINGSYNLKVKAGEAFDFSFLLTGSPHPQLTWKSEQAPDRSTGFEIETNNTEGVKISKAKVNFEDNGIYLLEAENEMGKSEVKVNLTVLDVPAMPVGPIEFSNPSTDRITLNWTQPANDGNSAILNYRVEKQQEGSDEWILCSDAATTCKYTVQNLKQNAKYKFRVRAENKFGCSEPLDAESYVTIKPPFDPPSQPGQPQIIDYSPSCIKVQWTRPEKDGGNPITGYMVEMKTADADKWKPVSRRPTTLNTFEATDLVENQTYRFRVKALNEAGEGKASLPSEDQETRKKITIPGVPSLPNVENVTNESCTLTWKKDVDVNDESYPSEVIIEISEDNGLTWRHAGTAPYEDKKFTISDLGDVSKACFRIQARNDAGLSRPSDATVSAYIDDTKKPEFVGIYGPQHITVKAHDPLKMKFGHLSGSNTSYKLYKNGFELEDDGKDFNVSVLQDYITVDKNDATRSDSGLYEIELINRLGSVRLPINVTVQDVPSPPSGPLEISKIEDSSCVLNWSPPADDGGLPLGKYIVERRLADTNKDWETVAGNFRSTECNMNELSTGKKYEFRIFAQNDIGKSEPLITSSPVNIKYPFNVPGQPSEISYKQYNYSSVAVQWEKPLDDGGNEISGYMVEYKDTEGQKWIAANKQPVRDNEITIFGLTEGKQYDVRVSAVNKAGQGDWCASDEPLQPRAPDARPVLYGFEVGRKDVKVKRNQPIMFRIPFVASPMPVAQLSKRDVLPMGASDLKLQVQDGQVLVSSDKAELNQAGAYTFSLENVHGKETGVVNLVVLDTPSQPNGPIQVANLRPDGCRISWEPPKHDGGESITNYVIEMTDLNNPDFWESISKTCKSTSFEVSDLEPGHQYKFRVFAENLCGLSEPLQMSDPIVARFPFSSPEKPLDFKATSSDLQSIDLSWARPRSDGGSKISEYVIDMRKKGEEVWMPIQHVQPRVSEVKVENLVPGVIYEFRIKAKNEAGFSEPTELDRDAMTKESIKKPLKPNKPNIVDVGKDFVSLNWDVPIESPGYPVTSYKIEYKSPTDADWKTGDTIRAEDLTDVVSIRGLPEYSLQEFRLKALNDAGESEASLSTAPIRITQFSNGCKPEFIESLKDQEILVNQPSVFSVKFEALPAPEVTWFKNGIMITPGLRYSLEKGDNSSTLRISDVWESDDRSSICCELKNPFGNARSECFVRLKEPLKVDEYTKDQSVSAHETFRMKLPVRGEGPFTFKLTKDGETVRLGNEIKVIEIDGTVTVSMDDACRADAGAYILNIAGDSGNLNAPFNLNVHDVPGKVQGPLAVTDIGKSECTITWQRPNDNGGSKITNYAVEKRDINEADSDWTLVPNSTKECKCTVTGLNNGHSYEFRVAAINAQGIGEYKSTQEAITIGLPYDKPTGVTSVQVSDATSSSVRLKWDAPMLKAGTPIVGYYIERKEENSDNWIRLNSCPATSLNADTVRGLVEGCKYQFRVIPFNEAGESENSIPTEYVTIKEESLLLPPTIKAGLRNQQVNEGETVSFKVQFEGTDTSVAWFKNNVELFDDFTSKYKITTDKMSSQIAINNVQKSDADVYTIKIKNKAGVKSTFGTLEVNVPPKLMLNATAGLTEMVTYKVGEKIKVQIPYNGVPVPSVKLTRDNVSLPEDARIDYYIDDKFVTLTIPSAEVGDTGVYGIELTNDVGTANGDIRIKVVDHPDPPEHLACNEITDEMISLSWKEPKFDGGSEITNYVIERQEQGSDDWVRSGFVRRACKLNIEHLQPGHGYRFRVMAENMYGRSVPSETTEFVTTQNSLLKRKATLGVYGADSDGKPIRGLKGHTPLNYDKCYQDIWMHGQPPSPITKRNSIYDYYDVFEEISSTAECSIHRAVERNTGRSYIVKFYDTGNKTVKEMVDREISIGKKLKHKNILNLHDVFEPLSVDAEPNTALVYELASGGDLLDRMFSPLTEQEVADYIRQICEGVRHMHEKNIVNLNIKPTGILFDKSNEGQYLKIADMRSARKFNVDDTFKLSIEDSEFAAPEVLEEKPVGFYTDMWAVGTLTHFLLTGDSPFPAKDGETKGKTSSYVFDQSKLAGITEEGKDFISKLLVKEAKSRMTASEALNHQWLTQSRTCNDNLIIDEVSAKDRKMKYLSKSEIRLSGKRTMPSIGRTANYVSINEFNSADYISTRFDRQEACPRIVIKPHNAYCMEGDNATFECRIVALSPPIISWYRNGIELRQSQKYSKKSTDTTYCLEVKKCLLEDEGKYEMRASNSFGETLISVNLSVQPVAQPRPLMKKSPTIEYRRSQYELDDIWSEPDRAPMFTYHLRSRVVQAGQNVKLSCTVTAKPTPSVKWYKDATEIKTGETNMLILNESGVCSLEIAAVNPTTDGGWYRCVAENERGVAETTSQLLVIGSSLNYQTEQGSSYFEDFTSSYGTRPLSIKRSVVERYGTLSPSISGSRAGSLVGDVFINSPPNFVCHLESSRVEEFSDIILKCTFTGRPAPEIEWFKNGQLIRFDLPASQNQNRFCLYTSSSETSLTIRNATLSDSGQYRCRLSNARGYAESSASIHVINKDDSIISTKTTTVFRQHSNRNESAINIASSEFRIASPSEFAKLKDFTNGHRIALDGTSINEPQYFHEFLKSMILNEGDTLNLVAETSRESDIDEIRWYRNNKTVPDSVEFEKTSKGKIHRLSVPVVFPEDSGVFTVEHTSPDGTVISSNCSIIVKGSETPTLDPCIIAFPQSVCVSIDDSPTFRCVAIGSEPMSAIWSKSGIPLLEGDHFYMTSNSTNSFLMKINKVSMNDAGIYEVRVVNSNGDMIVVFDVHVKSMKQRDL
ncbi:hypothetical protein ACOME3_008952 [Neoechinorhynchus agilis]